MMRRTGLRTAMLVVVLAALAGIAYQTWRSVRASRAGRIAGLVREIVPDVTQHIRDFRRVKMKKGKPVWEVEAAEARYYEEDERVVVRAPRVVLYFDDGKRRAELSGREGHLELSGQELDAVRLEGDVRLLLDDLELETENATYERARDMVVAPGEVTIRGRDLDVQARGMEVELAVQHLRLLSDVRTEMRVDADDS